VIGMMPAKMARILIVGCGGRGQALARELVAAGHAVRGTTRDPRRFPAIEAAGAEPYLGDPDRVMTLMDALTATTIVCWLMGSATGPEEQVRELHGGRLRMLCEKIVDTPVRGLVYEAAGCVPYAWREQGELIVRGARATWNIPLEVLDTDPAQCDDWRRDARDAIGRLLGA
jgi:NAD(P)-dependent dehydrogenase (short-subunit alcohol dehydrogenase family)